MPTEDYMSAMAKTAKTVAIDVGSMGDNTIFTPSAGKRFLVHEIYMRFGGNVDVIYKSGSNALSGALSFGTSDTLDEQPSVVPVFIGRATDEAFIINLSSAVAVDGWVVVNQVDGDPPF